MPRLTGSHLSQVYDFSSLERRIKRYVDDTHVRFIRGYFNESLTKALAPVLRPALFVDIDVDLYISTMQALDYMLTNKLIVVGTLVGFDDWPAGGRRGGEQRAHRELTKKWGLRWKNIVPGCKEDRANKMQCVFELLAIGAATPDCDCLEPRAVPFRDRLTSRHGSSASA